MDKDFEKSCRLCAKVQDVSIMIFSKEAENLRLQSKLNKYLLIEIEEDDKLPKIICVNCCSNLQLVCNFIDAAHKSQAVLQERSSVLEQQLTSINPTTNIIGIQTVVKTESLSEDDEANNDNDGMEISVDPMMVLQNSDDIPSPIPEPEQNSHSNDEVHGDSEEEVDVTHLHSVDSENVSIKLIRKVLRTSDSNHSHPKLGEFEDKMKDPSWKPFPCITCRRSFYTELALKNHSWIHVNEEKVTKQYRCSICHEEYGDKAALIEHLKKHRMSGMCKLCGRIFRSERNLAAHMAVHLSSGKSFTCKVCGRSYNTKSNLKTHSITHSTLRPYECHICKKSFKRNQDLKFHINQHTGAKPYKCPFCDKCFASSGNCYSHRSRMHPGKFVDGKVRRRVQVVRTPSASVTPAPISVKGVLKYQCQYCEHSFLKRENFTYHMFQHTGEKAFRCKYCEENFVTRRGLLLHHDKKHPNQNRPLALISKNVLLK